jgi:NarL family two-component system response regulator YdfI
VIRVFIIAASPLVRSDLEDLLKARALKTAGIAPNLEGAEAQLLDTNVDVVLIDANREQTQPSEHDSLRDLAQNSVQALIDSGLPSELAVVVLADRLPRPSSTAALRAGVRAVLPRDVSPDQLAGALEAAASGLVVLHPAYVEDALPAPAAASGALAELAEPLTRREREVLQMLASGFGNKEIASRLAISEHTVKFHVTSILGKLSAETRTEAVSLGIRRGLVLL